MQSETRFTSHRSRTVVDVGITAAKTDRGVIYLTLKMVNKDKWLRMAMTEAEALSIADGIRRIVLGDTGTNLLT